MVTAEMFALLDRLGATEPARGARPLLDHLDGTRAVLAAWGSPAELCLRARRGRARLFVQRPRTTALVRQRGAIR
jgi:hypothetical protein